MKQQNEKKLRLGKHTIQDLDSHLDREAQDAIKGGNDQNVQASTIMPVIC
jgi:hypothetical protein